MKIKHTFAESTFEIIHKLFAQKKRITFTSLNSRPANDVIVSRCNVLVIQAKKSLEDIFHFNEFIMHSLCYD